ncbi:MAG TPA: ABC transporter ATP-binding protein [Phenylobacterium sp.]|nr:ABC transporter ATP-binding protein [Phenylobacterium sp.]
MSEIYDDEDDRGPRVLTNTQVLGYIWKKWLLQPGRLTWIMALFLVSTACDIAIPWASRALVNAVADPARVADNAWVAWAALTGLYLAFYTVRTFGFRALNVFSSTNMQQIADEGFKNVQSFSSEWHNSNFAGSTVRKVTRAMWGYDMVTDAILIMLIPTLLVLGGMAVSMGVRWPLAGVFVASVVVIFMTYNILATRYYIRPVNLISNALDTRIGGALADAISGNAVVKGFGAEAREEARFGKLAAEWQRAVSRTWNRFNTVGVIQNFLLLVLQAGLTGFVVHAWAQGTATPGDVAFAITSFMLMAGYMRNFSEITRMLQRGLDDTLDVAVFARTPPQLADKPGAPDFLGEMGEIVFERASFGYENQGGQLYSDFSLTIRPGERVALVGPTGSGKTTFVKLVQRLYDLQGGRILIDGIDIAGVTQGSLRRAIAVVPQDPALFHRSIAENIAYARPDATPEEIELAARRARAHDFIAKLPQGYATLVGERGVKLSGGERQRVAIARAFLADAPILVLDEATSSLDVETEKQVQAAVEELMVGRTTIVIAHRLSTIRSADRILVFDKGRIVEEGNHRELVNAGGPYARLHAVTEGAH